MFSKIYTLFEVISKHFDWAKRAFLKRITLNFLFRYFCLSLLLLTILTSFYAFFLLPTLLLWFGPAPVITGGLRPKDNVEDLTQFSNPAVDDIPDNVAVQIGTYYAVVSHYD